MKHTLKVILALGVLTASPATFDRKFSNDNALHLGFRIWGLDYSENKNSLNARAALDATMYGFLVGYEFN